MKIIVEATRNHQGGGKVILVDFLNAAKEYLHLYFIVYVDNRFDKNEYISKNITFINVGVINRIFLPLYIKKLEKSNDIIIYFGNVSPYIKHKSTTILIQSNRYLLENYTTKNFKLKHKIRINLERLIFKLTMRNVNCIIVQSNLMKRLLLKKGYHNKLIRVLPYKNKDLITYSKSKIIKNSFLYVASGEPHKNHIKLIKAWILLARQNIRPILILTIDNNTILSKYVNDKKSEYNLNIIIKEKLTRSNLIKYYSKVKAIIYPSLFESYGLPIVEALSYNIPIIASELDFIRELTDPEETFDPNSEYSISRAVKRFLKVTDNKTNVINGKQFVEKLINMACQNKN